MIANQSSANLRFVCAEDKTVISLRGVRPQPEAANLTMFANALKIASEEKNHPTGAILTVTTKFEEV